MILFLVKANYKIGFGHLSRCSSIAQELRSFNEKKLLPNISVYILITQGKKGGFEK